MKNTYMDILPVTLLKLGGSLITDKSKPYTEKTEIINVLVRQIHEALKENDSLRLIIGNGAGSYAHYPAKLYDVSNGIVRESQKMGFCMVQDGAARLNRIIVSALLQTGVRAVSISPSSLCITNNGKIKKFFLEPILGLLSLNIVPVLYGDIVFDEVKGCAIISTEVLLSHIARLFIKQKRTIKAIIHNGVTKGVLDLSGNVIPVITQKNIKRLQKVFTSVKGYDVTGGMVHKVRESLKLTKYGIESRIINGISEENLLKRALRGSATSGTKIEAA